jgi:hypothetical protein
LIFCVIAGFDPNATWCATASSAKCPDGIHALPARRIEEWMAKDKAAQMVNNQRSE